MEQLKIISKTHGVHFALFDKEDFIIINKLGGKWCVSKKRNRFYLQKRIKGKLIEIQRYLLTPKEGEYVDHINGNPLDNRRKNLRICTNAANLRNGRIRSNNTTGIIGVTWDRSRSRWVAKIKVFYKTIYLGRYKNRKDAIQARKQAEIEYFDI